MKKGLLLNIIGVVLFALGGLNIGLTALHKAGDFIPVWPLTAPPPTWTIFMFFIGAVLAILIGAGLSSEFDPVRRKTCRLPR